MDVDLKLCAVCMVADNGTQDLGFDGACMVVDFEFHSMVVNEAC